MEFYTADFYPNTKYYQGEPYTLEDPTIDVLRQTPQHIQCVLATGANSSDVLEIGYNPENQRIIVQKVVGDQIEYTVFKDPYISLSGALKMLGVGLPLVGIISYDPTFTVENDTDAFARRGIRSMPTCQIVVTDMWNHRHVLEDM